jgi:hypothetical protein
MYVVVAEAGDIGFTTSEMKSVTYIVLSKLLNVIPKTFDKIGMVFITKLVEQSITETSLEP